MLFQLPNTLTKFVGRTQKAGKEDVPAVSFRLKLSSVPNVMLDLLSKTMRHTAYEAVPGQEQLPGVEATTPILRSKDLKHWAPETTLEGWSVIVARGISDDDALQMGSCKLDDFRCDLYEGGHVDIDFRVGTADLDEAGAGMLWAAKSARCLLRSRRRSCLSRSRRRSTARPPHSRPTTRTRPMPVTCSQRRTRAAATARTGHSRGRRTASRRWARQGPAPASRIKPVGRWVKVVRRTHRTRRLMPLLRRSPNRAADGGLLLGRWSEP